ncbi:Peptidase C48, SUMO/Sentrin/Ubl1 [Corchorus olitorius]|uniref:Peptidase C48, SUMO/Sentrin/Ubl1 n=1 Tax=Corchorus olitorius TaxID=93759 RepID=A0A1R3GZE2_9ROSI|nr:Peptidase C48, SUMO/Sentrin/Ubl1 [Corchorus olitorius]
MSRKASERDRRFDVFDYTDEDERVETESAKILGKFKKPKCARTPSPLDKYKFLQCFSRPNEISNRPIDLDMEVADGSKTKQKEVNSEPIALDTEVTKHRVSQGCKTRGKKGINGPIEVDAEVLQSRKTREKKNINGPIYIDAEVLQSCKTQVKKNISGPIDVDAEVLQSCKTREKKISDGPIDIESEEMKVTKTTQKSSRDKCGDIDASVTGQQRTFRGYCPVSITQEKISNLNTSLQAFSSNCENEQVTIISDDDGRTGMSSSSAFACSSVECTDSPEEQLSAHGSHEHQIETENVQVVIAPDFMLYKGIYSTECQLIFSKTSLKCKGLTVNGTKKKFSFVWTVGDIISIEAQWWEGVETAIINLGLRSKSSRSAGFANETSAIDALKFAVYDPCWSERQAAIRSLSVRYNDRWKTTSADNEENAFMGQNSRFFSEPSISDFDEHVKEVIYPKGDPDAVSISKRDVALLQPKTFINDTIIDFYINFFFRKLADQDKDLSGAFQARAAFQRVHKWTRKVDIFEKDYIFIPVNYSYLSEEWKERHRDAADDVPSKFLHVQFVPLELPQQENSFDCGLFLLHYVELFLLEAPTNFKPSKITGSSNFLNRKWFPPNEASLKRFRIKKLIYEILEEQSRGSTLADSLNLHPSSLLPIRNEHETGVQFLEQFSSSGESSHRHSSKSNVKQGSNKLSLSLQSPKDSRLAIFERYENERYKVGIRGVLLSDENHQQINTLHRKNVMSPIEEIETPAAESPSEVNGQQHVPGSISEACLSMRYLSEDFGVRMNQQNPLHFEDSAIDSCCGDSLDSSSEMRRLEEDDQHLPELEESSHQGKTNKAESCSTSNEGYFDCVVEDSEESSGGIMHDDEDIQSTFSPSSFLRNVSALSRRQANLTTEELHLKEIKTPLRCRR